HSMNDSHENIWADRFIVPELRNLVPTIGQGPVELAWEMYLYNKPNPFIFCLSAEPDVLSQWRGYAKDGTGIAIGFDANTLTKNRHKPMHNLAPGMSLTLQPVVYNME